MNFGTIVYSVINPSSTNPQNGHTYSNDSSAKADKLLDCVWPFYGIGV